MLPHAEAIDDLEIPKQSCSLNERDFSRHDGVRIMSMDGTLPPAPKFHNASDPAYEVQKEKPAHRHIAYLLAQGFSMKDIADETGYGRHHVSQLSRQPWMRDLVAFFLQQAGYDPLMKMFQGAAKDSFYTLIELRDNKMTPPATREKISNSFIDRVCGKAPVHVKHENIGPVEDPKVEADQLYAELQKVEEAKRKAQENINKERKSNEPSQSTDSTSFPCPFEFGPEADGSPDKPTNTLLEGLD